VSHALDRRRADIQGLRAVAILLVVLYHGGYHVRGGFSGVDVFFAISGFVITGTLLRELEARGSIHLLSFYARRVRRLLPALATMVAVVTLAGILLTPIAALTITSWTGAYASIFGANVYLSRLGTGYFDVSSTLDPLLHTWTLGVEEQFYVVFPTLLLVSWLVGRRMARVASTATIAVVSLASAVLAVALWRGTVTGAHGQQYAFYLSPPRAWEFGLGALVALCAPVVERVPRIVARTAAVAGAGAIAAGAAVLSSTAVSPPRLALPVVGTCALLAAGSVDSGGIARILSLRPLTWIGDVSYSWYLWHWPFIVFAKALWPQSGAAAPVAAAISLLPAWASFRFVENPIRRRRDLVGRRAFALASVCVVAGVGASLALLGADHALRHTAAVRSWRASQAPHADEVRHCDTGAPLGGRLALDCTWRVAHPKGLIVLIGDSNAGHFTEPVTRAGNDLGYDVTVATFDGCPYIDLVVRPLGGNGPCRQFYVVSTLAMERLQPNLVVVAGRDDQYVYSYGIGKPGDPLTRNTPTRIRLWGEGLRATVRTLAARHIPVVVVAPVPLLPVPSGDCATVRILTSSCAGSVSRRTVDEELGPVVRAERAAVAAAHDAAAIDFEGVLCTRARCSSTHGGTVLYRNGSHLSVEGALALTPRFRAVIAAHVRR
jgi:peptidoglycan/LPS O-acetylase OafA/YrhL